MKLSKLGRHNEPVPKNVASPVVYWLFLVLKWVQCSHPFLRLFHQAKLRYINRDVL